MNKLFNTDYYKITHPLQYPKKSEYIYSYGESRGGKFDFTLFYGLQGFMIEYLQGQFVTQEDIDEAALFYQQGFGFDYFNREGWEYILKEHGGFLPVVIKAVREGSIVPTNNVLFTIENTDPKVPWLTQFLETSLLRGVWYPTTVATLSRQFKNIIQEYADKTGCEASPFGLLDFGARGVSSHESAGIGGSAHLVNFLGTDTVEGVRYAMRYYNAPVCGFSVFATEHSTTTIYGKEGELEAFTHFLNTVPDDATISIVIDSYDPENAVKNLLGGVLKEKILDRKGKTVFRPDSGNIIKVPAEVVGWLKDIFGGTINFKGFFELNPKVSVLQGDGCSIEVAPKILDNLVENEYATSNVIFGMGGKLLQGVDRDTQKWAVKVSSSVIDGKRMKVFKDPVSDPEKRSKAGLMKLVKMQKNALDINEGFGYKTLTEDYPLFHDFQDELVEVFRDGKVLNEQTFEEIKARANSKKIND